FQACAPDSGCEVWQADAAGTRLSADIAPGPDSSNPGPFTVSGGRVFFSAATPSIGTELWVLAPCAGDCDDSGAVGIDELVSAVRISLNELPTSRCTAVDANADGRVSIDELVRAVNAALRGCA